MQMFFEFHSELDSFRLFSAEHLMTIGVIVVLCIFLIVFKNSLEERRTRGIWCFILTVILCVSVALQHLWLVYENAWSLKRDLPFHLSDLAVILAIVMLLTRSYILFQFMYFAGLGSSIQAVLTPDLGRFSFPHFQYVQFFVSHGGVVLTCLFMVVAFNYRPTIRSMWVTILIVNMYTACVFFLNRLLGANYLYIMNKPKGVSLLDYLGSWPWYLLSLEMLLILSFYILYSPFWIKRKMKKEPDGYLL